MSWYAQPVSTVLKSLSVSAQDGLSNADAERRLKEHGPNTIEQAHAISLGRILLGQFANPMVWILLGAMVVSAAVREWTDAGVIAAIVILNAVLGCVQEYRAEKAIAALKKLLGLKARVLRDGEIREIDAALLVAGDIVLLETGDKVPADVRLIESMNVRTQEAALTGESSPVPKGIEPVGAHVAVADQLCMAFAGTIVTAGRAKAVVVATGMKTEMGKIAKMIEDAEPEPTPLQRQLAVLSKQLGFLVMIIAVAVFVAGIVHGYPAVEMLIAAIALAVAAIPEGLPAVVTVALGLSVQQMAKRNALVRKLPSVETLGACTVICSDKTGTLTHNQMTVKYVYANHESVAVSGAGYSPEGQFLKDPKQFSKLLEIGALNNNARVHRDGKEWHVIGDPTEAALIVAARKAGMDVEKLAAASPRVKEIEFTSERKMMATAHRHGGKTLVCVKGAPETVVRLCTRQLVNGQVARLSRSDVEQITAANDAYAAKALRVLAFAYKEIPAGGKEALEDELIFAGLQAMIDPPRSEVREAIQKCKTAGIKVVMITGDHAVTAQAIARELGIEGRTVLGTDIDHLAHLESHVEEIGVYARVNPEHKIRIVEAFKKRGHTVAMTGDGVNDAPALKKADLGIAMGISGTDVAKEASAMVLADDNFASIVRAVEEGRVIYDNIKKFVTYLLSSNIGEVLTLTIGLLLGWPLPVTALMILWINLVTDGAPALALGVDTPSPDLMKRPPRKVHARIVSPARGTLLVLIGVIVTLGTLFVFDWYEPATQLAKAQTAAFTALVLFQMFNVLNTRSSEHSALRGLFSNKWLWGAILLSVGLQVAVVHAPVMQRLFGTVALSLKDWLFITAVSSSVLVFGEAVKMLRR